MKNLHTFALTFVSILALNSCTNNSTETTTNTPPPTQAQFAAVRDAALQTSKQNFNMTAGTGIVTFTSAKGVTISINSNCLTKNGNAVTGAVDIEYVELFEKGKMLVTNKPTVGMLSNGNKELMKSGGEFFIKATQGGVDLVSTCMITLKVPGNLTGNVDPAMTIWQGVNADTENLVWRKLDFGPNGAVGGGVDGNGLTNTYTVSFGNFGWTNVDKFYSDPRPKTTILVGAPAGFDNTNCAIYLSYDGEGQNQLAKLDTYITATNLFSEHYGQIPVGLNCHIIFATSSGTNWKYAIKGVTTTANAVYNFTEAETQIVTEAQLVAAINAIQ
jgi:hypothetical protein